MQNKKEIWKLVNNYANYEISNYGNIRNNEKNKELKKHIDKCGYLRVILSKKNKKKSCLIHRLVAQAFLKDYDENLQVNHKDEDKTNNNVENLEMCTAKYNCNYGTRNERIGPKISQANKGKHFSKETEFKKGQIAWNKGIKIYNNAKKVRCIELNKVYNSINDASEDLNLISQNICRSCKTNYKTGGYSFRYE